MVVDPATQIRATVVALFDSLSSSSAVSDSFSCIGKILIASFISALSCTAPRSLLKLLCSISKRDQDGHNDSTYKRDFLGHFSDPKWKFLNSVPLRYDLLCIFSWFDLSPSILGSWPLNWLQFSNPSRSIAR